MNKTRIEISPLIENQKVELILEENSEDTEVFVFHKYSLEGEKYRINIRLNSYAEPEIICEEGIGKILKKVKKEVKDSISGDKRRNFAADLKKAMIEFGIEESAYSVFERLVNGASGYFGIIPDNEEPLQKTKDSYVRFCNNKKFYLSILKEKGLFAIIICANIGIWKFKQ